MNGPILALQLNTGTIHPRIFKITQWFANFLISPGNCLACLILSVSLHSRKTEDKHNKIVSMISVCEYNSPSCCARSASLV